MIESDFPPLAARRESTGAEAHPVDASRRLRKLIDTHYDFVWRTLRHFGMNDANAEDGAQQVMCVLARRLGDIAVGAEVRFLFSTTLRVASESRRLARRRPVPSEAEVDALANNAPGTEELLDERRAHDVLRRVLDAIPVDLRIVFVLFEIEELSMPEIAEMLSIPVGTVASRLRRGREAFHVIARRVKAAQSHHGAGP
ncbi:MAG: sigma-70 family RNA polymerase sigma factor [Polyangiaceae bacterium]|nr:sigma-70 family RNA polymerase sigma factor [Polyangiaceae bacterium]